MDFVYLNCEIKYVKYKCTDMYIFMYGLAATIDVQSNFVESNKDLIKANKKLKATFWKPSQLIYPDFEHIFYIILK